MLDTIAVGFPVAPTPKQLSEWRYRHTRYPSGNVQEVFSIYLDGGKQNWIIAKYYPQDVCGQKNDLTIIELSLPFSVYGCNFRLLDDISEGIQCANAIIKRLPTLPNVNLNEGTIYRLDPCTNYQVGTYSNDYIQCLSRCHYPHRVTRPYASNGVLFKASLVSSKFYDKHLQCGRPEALGLLRHEITFRDRGEIGKMVGKSAATINDFDPVRLESALVKDLKILGLYQKQICNRDMALERLKKVYGPKKAYYLFGYLLDIQSLSREQIALENKISMSAIGYRDEMIRKAGVPLTLTDRKVALPPLYSLNLPQTPSDTLEVQES